MQPPQLKYSRACPNYPIRYFGRAEMQALANRLYTGAIPVSTSKFHRRSQRAGAVCKTVSFGMNKCKSYVVHQIWAIS